ncbi:hypothetical protein P3602_21335 [Vibrio parahaemolyticus]|uniref:hypothetical protein n=1 Tax=Vibrio TaxID=662 RepID=UPI001B842F53|nr:MULTISPECIES: hypothetical protein [Vibrio]MCA2420880.1 hypothetical protein [Vibrio alginolyticus]MCA2445654.1 hypothetical protein [Vibrio alginolyticus]MDF5108454.1 hypothetical protein [Vibrio parahaemolyticus]MDF5143359.1 hypothetical protein [Vibrio parahaemolyticus]MDF5153785.1 hypothetical protein [Vibrio parahaemolyticus]
MIEAAKDNKPTTWQEDLQKLVLGAVAFNLGVLGLLLRFGIIQFSDSIPEELLYGINTLTSKVLFVPLCLTLIGVGMLFIWVVLQEPIRELRAWLKRH